MAPAIFAENLESRLLMAVNTNAVLSTAVQTDRLQVQIDLLKFKADCFNDSSTILSDILKIKSDDPTQVATIAPEVKKMRTDLRAMWQQFRVDRLAQAGNVLADESVIVRDRLQALRDHGTAAETADRAKLLADRIKLQTDIVTGLNTRIQTRQTDYATNFSDAQAVATAAQNQPAVAADVAKWANDRTTCMNTMSADLQALVNDRTQLIADLTAQRAAA